MKRLYPFLSRRRVAILEACIIGLVSGLAAVALKQGVEGLIQWRSEPIVSTWLLFPTIGLIGGWLSGWAIQQFAPETSGSGIPHIKAVLGYVPMALNLRVALVKLVSTLLALGSGLSLGRQGPTVQIGAALAAQLSHWVPTSPEYRRQLISAGAAAGLAAGFNAPISGILFVVEELLQDFSGLTLGSAILASFVGAVVSRLLGGQGLNLTMGTLPVGLGLADLPFLVLLGLMAGVLGTLFNRGIFASLSFFRRMKGISLPGRVGLAGLLTGLVGIWLPIAAQDNTGLREFLVTGEAGWQLIAVAFLAKFGLTLIAYGSGAPGGIFAPTLVLGSALGCLVSFLAQGIYGGLGLPLVAASTTTYALTGMGAFFSAVTRVPITAIVIVFEMTANFNLVLPLMIGAGIAYLISERVASGSVYSGLLRWQGIELEATPTATNPWMNLTAADLMQRRVETLSSQMTLQEAMEAFSRSHHRGFPVVDGRRLVGIVTQSDLGAAKVQAREAALPLTQIMTPHPVTVNPTASLTQVLHLLNQLKISRLPVTQEGKLVGIITRGDIIRAESDQVSGQANPPGPQASPSYPVYQIRGPATGQGRLLLPLSDPNSAPLLLQMALAMAKAQQYEVECLHVIKVPRSVPPPEATVDLRSARRLLWRAERLGRQQGVSVHGQIRVAHEVARTLLEVIKERHIDLILMGCNGRPRRQGGCWGRLWIR
ncbi:Chlorine channel protein [Halomicronema hongdechloris C2206]|uniref:Chlorine channel protein n=1 Tax=Halomicronema hongdechloris C2206 TaxID=1641165 RepID=A0A1Z3HKC4_9CYAN|nr:chloride channel protein [Halomicronema hongdechloris]ASC70750.1 Chlorine channel protein [Halomicronema hongdechloris C2206]